MDTLLPSDELAHFVARMKLTELERQHARLLAAYDEIEHSAGEASSLGAAACVLWDGLRQLTLAQRELHPRLDDISILRAKVDAGLDADDIAETWISRLQREVEQGRARANVAKTFGQLLEEHTATSPDEVPEEAATAYREWVHRMHASARPTAHGALFDEVFANFDPEQLDRVCGRISQQLGDVEGFRHQMRYFPDGLVEVCGPDELEAARRVSYDETSVRELTDAMCIMLENIEDWSWPLARVDHTPRWTQHRWRVYPQEPLSAAIFAEITSSWILDVVHDSLNSGGARADRLARLIELNAPSIIIENERRMLEEATSLGSHEQIVFDALIDHATRLDRQAAIRELREQSQHGNYDYEPTLGKAAGLVAADVRLQRLARPDEPVWIVKTDITEFFASVEHAVVLDLLERLGVDAQWRDHIARFLAIPVEGEPARRGLPMGHRTSRLLAELLLFFMDVFVNVSAKVRIVRAVDDICLLAGSADELAKGYACVVQFLEACGLEINVEKSGSVVIGGESSNPNGLPDGEVRWGLLTLDPDGEWSIDLAAVEERVARAKQRMDATHGVMRRVEIYNDEARGLVAYLGLRNDLGDPHRARVREAVTHFVDAMGAMSADMGAAWLRWPITAGGLGLYDPLVEVLCYELCFAERWAPRVPQADLPEDESRRQWVSLYQRLSRSVWPERPSQSAPLEELVRDFIHRNSELHGGNASGELSPYWTWTLHTYGPEILERFGTFRFLLTELVPLKLILRVRS